MSTPHPLTHSILIAVPLVDEPLDGETAEDLSTELITEFTIKRALGDVLGSVETPDGLELQLAIADPATTVPAIYAALRTIRLADLQTLADVASVSITPLAQLRPDDLAPPTWPRSSAKARRPGAGVTRRSRPRSPPRLTPAG